LRRLCILLRRGGVAHRAVAAPNAEASRGRLNEAADAWRTALATRFDPTIAAEVAEAITESQGHITDEAAGLFCRALAEAPADAAWRPMVQKRLSQIM
jgi:cytochrome c-type biogenesis protein CcmH